MAKSSTRLKAVILAGGSGERFWPLSTPERPKQFLDIFGGKSLLRQSVERLQGLVAPEDVIVVTASQLVSATQRELPEVPPGNIIGEPCRRDTAAAVAMGVAAAGEGMVGVFPADQLVSRPGRFRQAVRQAAKLASASERIAVLGIEPLAPSTQFGYINPKTGKFVEKP
ncbi:MAG: NTP transferase domain-containing protein, partial [Kiritimatiellae bacterium]|nr:NTP transferase domain-containing protein [Kiritimatiellia bacterium]